MASVSHGWRLQGNQFFNSYQLSTNFQDKKKYLETAIRFYSRAFATADNNDDKASAAKNQGTAELKLASLLTELKENPAMVEFHYAEALKYLGLAHGFGVRCKSTEWNDSLMLLYTECVENKLQQLRALPLLDKRKELWKFVMQMEVENLQKAECFLELATIEFYAGVTALAEKDHKKALRAFNDSFYPVEECIRLAPTDQKLVSEANILKEDLLLNTARAEALQAIALGDDSLNFALKDSEVLDMTSVYNALDYYKQAILLTKEIELEVEAIATSRAGYVYDQVIKLKHKSRQYFHQCMNLAFSLLPRTFHSEEWYITCTKTLQRYQEEAVSADEAEKQQEQERLRQEMQPELDELLQADVGSGPDALLRYIYQKYPPANPNDKLDESKLVNAERKEMKKILHAAIKAYHPDKYSEHGESRKILCTEITKLLNKRYENFKVEETSTN